MRKNRISIIGLQETKLDENEALRIMQANLKIHNESNGVSTAKEDVAFIINKDLT